MFYAIGCFPDHSHALSAARGMTTMTERPAPVRLFIHASDAPDFGGLVDENSDEKFIAHAYPDPEIPADLEAVLQPFHEAMRRGATVALFPEADEARARADVARLFDLGARWPDDPALTEMDPKEAAKLFPYRGSSSIDLDAREDYAHVGSEHGVVDP